MFERSVDIDLREGDLTSAHLIGNRFAQEDHKRSQKRKVCGPSSGAVQSSPGPHAETHLASR
jgi:hypothetical protein